MHSNNFFPAGFSPFKEWESYRRQKKKPHKSKITKAKHHNSLRLLIKQEWLLIVSTYLQQMLPAIHFSLISSINAHHIIFISPPCSEKIKSRKATQSAENNLKTVWQTGVTKASNTWSWVMFNFWCLFHYFVPLVNSSQKIKNWYLYVWNLKCGKRLKTSRGPNTFERHCIFSELKVHLPTEQGLTYCYTSLHIYGVSNFLFQVPTKINIYI